MTLTVIVHKSDTLIRKTSHMYFKINMFKYSSTSLKKLKNKMQLKYDSYIFILFQTSQTSTREFREICLFIILGNTSSLL